MSKQTIRDHNSELFILKDRGEAPLCLCGCFNQVDWNKWRNRWNTYCRGHSAVKRKIPRPASNEAPLCACGCSVQVSWNEKTKDWNKYIRGHHMKTLEAKEKMRLRLAQQWEDPEFAQMRRDSARQQMLDRWADPAYRERHRERSREVMRKTSLRLWQDPEYRKDQQERGRVRSRTAEGRQHMKAMSRKAWEDVAFVERKRQAMVERWKDPIFAEKMSERTKQAGLERAANSDFREFMSQAFSSYWESPEAREQQRQRMKKRWEDPEFRKRQEELRRQRNYQQWKNPEYRRAMSVMMKELRKQWGQDPEYQRMLSEKAKKEWQDPVSRKAKIKKMSLSMRAFWSSDIGKQKMLASFGRRPNQLESYFDFLTPNSVCYVGDGAWWRSIVIQLPNGEYISKHKNPDFKVTGQNKVIELWGTFWHRDEFPEDLIEAYQDAGLQCLIVWEHELYEDTEAVLERVAEFIGEDTWQMSLPLKQEAVITTRRTASNRESL